MMSRVRNPLVVSCVYLWVGFVCAISFMEAWLKFQAPGVTLPVGLGIGRLVFKALNQIEWVFAIVIVLNFVIRRIRRPNNKMIFLVIPLIILTIQTLELLPTLDARATRVINGEFSEPSFTHTVYIVLEAVKVISLLIFGSTLFLHPRLKSVSAEPQH
jgi:hypothetical protein